MRVSPLDIRKQEFTRAFRGYEPEEVHAFLQMLSKEWEEMRDEHRRLEEQLRGVEDKIRHYERVEEALQEALQTARDSSRKTLQNAEEKARNIIKAAESKASEIQGEAAGKRDRLRQENSRLINRQHELVARLRAFLTSEIEMLERYESNQLVGSRSSEVEREPDSSRSYDPPRRPARPARQEPAPNVIPEFEDDVEDEDVPSASSSEPDDAPQEQDALTDRSFNVRSLVSAADAEADTDWEDDQADERGGDSFSAEDDDVSPDTFVDDSARGDEEISERDKTKARQATEEIEKIRRILNDLD